MQGRGGNARVKLLDGRDYAFISVHARIGDPGDHADEVNNALCGWVDNYLGENPYAQYAGGFHGCQ